MKKKVIFCIVFLIVIVLPVIAQAGIRRTALVIGNAAYKSSPLKNPVNDARDMAGVLKGLGFNVKLYVNADYKSMYEAIRSFGRELSRGGVGLFYYAGHGMQVKGTNYLIPVGAGIAEEDEVRFNAVDANLVLSKMESAGNRTNIVILDACRDNPFSRSFRSSSRGLAVVDAPRGSLVVYATAPGSVSADGSGRNGIFTGALLKHMRESGVDVEMMLREVRRDVMAETNNKQVPWSSSSLTGSFYFKGNGKGVKAEAVSAPAEKEVVTAAGSGSGTGTLFIKTDPLGAEVTVNGKDKGESPVLLDNIQLYTPLTVEVRKGNMYAKKEVSIKKRELTEVAFKLEVLKGSLFIKSNEYDVSVYIDGKSLGKIGAGLFRDIPVGSHKVELKGYGLYWKGNVGVLKDKVAVFKAEVKEVGSLHYVLPGGTSWRYGIAYTEDVTASIEGEDFMKKVSGSGTLENIPAGKYTVTAEGEGYTSKTEELYIVKGKQTGFEPRGSIVVKSIPGGAGVYIGNSYKGKAPVTIDSVLGKYELVLKYKGYYDAKKTVYAEGMQTKVVTVKMRLHAIGDSYAGGIVFYSDGKGHGLVAAPHDQGSYSWSNAKRVCRNLMLNGYSDWYLPSKNELNLMYNNLKRKGLGGFADAYYWSSSESGFFNAWNQNFTNGSQDSYYIKNDSDHVRAVRAF